MNERYSDPDALTVVVRCAESDSDLRLWDRWRLDEDSVHYAIEASAPGLAACVDQAVAGIWGPDLATFLDELAESFRGWTEERSWHSLDRDLTISAVFRAGGHIGLTWALRPWPAKYGGWSASVTTWLEADEQMSALAADVRTFLHHDAQQVRP